MDIEQLVASVTKGKPGTCWAARLTGPIKEFVDACTQVEVDGGHIDRTMFVDRMAEVYSFTGVSYSSVRHHLGGNCSCPR